MSQKISIKPAENSAVVLRYFERLYNRAEWREIVFKKLEYAYGFVNQRQRAYNEQGLGEVKFQVYTAEKADNAAERVIG